MISKSLFENEMKVLASEVDSPYDYKKSSRLCFNMADGCYLYDNEGNKYIDLINGKGSILLGHNNKEVNDAIINSITMKKNVHTGPTEAVVELSKIIINDIDLHDSKITYFSSGTAACRAAASVARMHTGKNIIISAGYHGWDIMWESSGKMLEANAHGVVDFYFIPQLLEKCIKKYNGNIALIILSPDYVYLEPNTIKNIFEIAKQNNILICCDDVKQGYRYRKGESIKHVIDYKADLYTFSKGLANGNRLSCLIGEADLMGEARDFTYTSYYNMIPIYAAIETLKQMKQKNAYEHISNIGKKLSFELNKIFAQSDLPIAVFGQGPMFQFVVDDEELEVDFYKECTKNGLLLFERDNQAISYCMDNKVIVEIKEIMNKVVETLRSAHKDKLGKSISSKGIFKTAWDMIDGAADIGTYEDKIKWIEELL